ncbi:PDR/VanB family oxidoreductase [Streptomyces sp. GbtcB6]|uniref:PDR/VanB family oxidoreductase n=1 Tax=Streptomyces sp. GbtcB6 TaxID=2824751 RepID=UPI001C30BCD1|nr:PDR/VanB family oxidoreductase [Streptomyces sp. GbtcB6]
MSTSTYSDLDQAVRVRLTVVVDRVAKVADDVAEFELIDAGGAALPAWTAGSHVDLVLPSGAIRQYSLCGDERDRDRYRIAVLREQAGRGGSQELHSADLVGTRLEITLARNNFPLCEASEHWLIAGGIGVTPLLAMARSLDRKGVPWQMLYTGRTRTSMAYAAELRELDPQRVRTVATTEEGRPDVSGFLAAASPTAAIYVCGPPELITAVQAACDTRGLDLHTERFSADAVTGPHESDGPIEVRLDRTGRTITVPRGCSILEAVRQELPDTPSSCEEGYCGTCETRVLAGRPEHRDTVLSARERERNDCMMICVSRAQTPELVLDL